MYRAWGTTRQSLGTNWKVSWKGEIRQEGNRAGQGKQDRGRAGQRSGEARRGQERQEKAKEARRG